MFSQTLDVIWCIILYINQYFFAQIFLTSRSENSGNLFWAMQCRMITTIYAECCGVPAVTCTADIANMTVCEEVFNATMSINLYDIISQNPERALKPQQLTNNNELSMS